MGKVLLIIGAVVGGLVFAFGALGLILAFAQPDANQSDEVVGAIFFMVVGAIVAAPCIFFAFRSGRRSAQPWQPGGALLPGSPSADLRASYLTWFAWCQQTLGGDAVSLHAATMAALAGGAAGNPAAAAAAEAALQAGRIAASGAAPAPPRAGKVARSPKSAPQRWGCWSLRNGSSCRSKALTSLRCGGALPSGPSEP